MKNNSDDPNNMFRHAREIIEQDKSIPSEEKDGILKLIQALIEAADASPYPREGNDQVKTFTQELISKHSLVTLIKQQADELNALKNISLMTSSLNLQTVLDAVVTEAMKLIKNASVVHIFLYSNGVLEFGACLDNEGVRNKPYAIPRARGITYTVANKGETIIVEDVKSHPIFQDLQSQWNGSIIGIPLKFNNVIVGVMNLSRYVVGAFTSAELRLLGLLADQAAVAISNANLHKGMMVLANTDSVTGLPNRRALDERLQDEARYSDRANVHFSVVMIDLDGFKHVNDALGHSIGDEVLRSVFNYLAGKMRVTDFLARYGGDELTLVMRESGQETAEIVTRKIIDLMKEYSFPNPKGKPIQLGLTAGIAVYPIHSQNTADLLRAADAALYQAKKYNRGHYVVAKGATGPLNPLALKNLPKS